MRRTLIAVALLMAAGCAGGSGDAGQVLHYRLREDPPTLDPVFVTDMVSAAVVRRMHAGLIDFDPETLQVTPRVAERWDISPDGATYTFHLRDGVRFHNGRQVTARDAAWSLHRLLDPATHSQRAWILEPLLGAADFEAGRTDSIAGVTVVDELTLRLELQRPYAPFLGQLAMENTAIVPREVFESRQGDPSEPEANIGCGPFRLREWVHSNYLALDAFDDYYEGRPSLDRVVFRFIDNLTTALEEYRAGGLDFLDEMVTGQRQALHEELGDEVRRWPQLATYFYGFNHQLPPFAGNRALRQAFNYAVDKEYICRVLQEGKDEPQRGILPPGVPGYNPDLQGYPYDPERARQLLVEAGYPEGRGLPEIPLLINSSENHQRIATQVQSDLAAVGIKIKIRTLDWAAYLNAIEGQDSGSGDVAMFRMGWFADYPDPDNFMYVLLHSSNWGPAGNHTRYANPEFDRLVDQARAMTRMEDRIPLYQEAERIAVEDAAWLFLYHYQDEALVKPYVRGLKLSPLGDHLAPLERVYLAAH